MPDTLKAQHIARLTRGLRALLGHGSGAVLGRRRHLRLARHDHRARWTRARTLDRSTASGSYQELRNDFYRNTRDNFLIELGKYGLGKRDIVAERELLREGGGRRERQPALVTGQLEGRATSSALRAELNTLVVLSNTPHPLDPAPSYAPKPVALTISPAQPAGPRRRLLGSSCAGERARLRAHRGYFS